METMVIVSQISWCHIPECSHPHSHYCETIQFSLNIICLLFSRNRMQLGSTQAFYLLVNNRSMLSLSKTMAEVYSEHQDDDGFLHVTYASQEVFGSGASGP